MKITYEEAWDMFFNQEHDEDMEGEVDYDLAESICLREMKEEQELKEAT